MAVITAIECDICESGISPGEEGYRVTCSGCDNEDERARKTTTMLLAKAYQLLSEARTADNLFLRHMREELEALGVLP